MIFRQRFGLVLLIGVTMSLIVNPVTPLDADFGLLVAFLVSIGLFLWPSKEERDE